MAKLWDKGLKRVLEMCPQGLVTAFYPQHKAHFTGIRSPELHSLSLQADAMVEMVMDGQAMMLHMEFQVKADPEMGLRLMEYNALGARRYKCPVYSVVIYLKKGNVLLETPYIQTLPNGTETARFHFGIVRLWEVPCSVLLAIAEEHLCMLPLIPLTIGGTNRAMVEHVIKLLLASGELANGTTKDLLSLTYLLASLAFNKSEERAWLKWRFHMLEDVLRETPAYQWIKEEGKLEGIEEGKLQGIEEGKLQGIEEGKLQGIERGKMQGLQEGKEEERTARLNVLRPRFIELIKTRFPQLATIAEQRVMNIKQLDELDMLILQVGMAHDSEEAQQALEEAEE